MRSFTPGPWEIDEQYIVVPRAQERGDWDNAYICQWAAYTDEANARLIAAAPDMYAALKSIASNTCCDGCREAAKVARAALVKFVLALALLFVAHPASADVYMFKGMGGVWSSGLGTACAFLNERKGIKCHLDETPKANGQPIVLVGHSIGGKTAIYHAQQMKVATVILLDPVGSVERLNARTISIHSEGWGNRVTHAAASIHCRDCSHTTLDDNAGIQYLIIREAMNAHGKY